MNHIQEFWNDETEFSSVTQSCLTLCNPMDCSTRGFPAHHQLLELAQSHVYQVSDILFLKESSLVESHVDPFNAGLMFQSPLWAGRWGTFTSGRAAALSLPISPSTWLSFFSSDMVLLQPFPVSPVAGLTVPSGTRQPRMFLQQEHLLWAQLPQQCGQYFTSPGAGRRKKLVTWGQDLALRICSDPSWPSTES